MLRYGNALAWSLPLSDGTFCATGILLDWNPYMIRILIVDDHLQTRKQIRELLESHNGWRVVAEGGDGHEAILHTTAHKPHIVLLDIQMPKMDGFEATRQILKTFPRMLILIISFHDGAYFADLEEFGRKGIFAEAAPRLQIDSCRRGYIGRRVTLSRRHGDSCVGSK